MAWWTTYVEDLLPKSGIFIPNRVKTSAELDIMRATVTELVKKGIADRTPRAG